jgi:hypothetical protein
MFASLTCGEWHVLNETTAVGARVAAAQPIVAHDQPSPDTSGAQNGAATTRDDDVDSIDSTTLVTSE